MPSPTAGPDGPSEPPATAQPLTFPASYAQERMWFFYRLDARNAFYNVPLLLRLTGGAPDTGALARALGDLVDRHETLRTTFADSAEGLLQVVADGLELPLATVDLTGVVAAGADLAADQELRERLLAEVRHPFDLERGPLLRPVLFRLGPADHLLLVCVHHIVIDGVSAGVFVREFAEAYRARAAGSAPGWPALEIQYGDFAEWQREHLAGEPLAEGLAYWSERLAGDLPVLRLPADRPRPAERSFAGDRLDFVLPPDLADAVKRLARDQGATLYMVLLAAFAALLHRTTGQDDILVGTPSANRDNAQLDPLIGMFVNTLPLRVDASGDPAFAALVHRVREVSLGAFAHQHIPLEKIVEEIAPQRDPGGNPLFQVVFALQNFDRPEIGLPGLTVTPATVADWTCRFDQELHLWEQDGTLRGTLVFATDLFDRRTARHATERLRLLLEAVTADPGLPLSRLPLAEDAADPVGFVGVTAAVPGYDRDATVTGRFAARVAATPAATALRTGPAALTYRDADARADRLARRLRARGVTPGSRVALCCGPGADGALALLAVVRAGAVGVPLDPADPPQRLTALLRRSGAAFVLTDAPPGTAGALAARPAADGPAPVVLDLAALAGPDALDAAAPAADAPAADDAPVPLTGRHPAVLLCAEEPPVAVDHAELVHQIDQLAAAAGLTAADTVRRWAPPGTARSVWETLLPLLHGAALAVPAGETEDDGASVALAVDRDLARLAAQPLPTTLRAVVHTGRALTPDQTARYHDALGAVLRPTHTTAATGPLAVADPGRPGALRPVRPLRVLDGYGRPAPLGVSGAVHLAPAADAPLPAGPAAAGTPTGDLGRLTEDGDLETTTRTPGLAQVGDHTLRLAALARRIRELEPVRDCALAVRHSTAGVAELVAYVVPTRDIGEERIVRAATGELPAALPLTAAVLVSDLPRTPGGALDEAALARIPVLDDDLLARWEDRWLTTAGRDRAAVSRVAHRPSGGPARRVRPPGPARPPVRAADQATPDLATPEPTTPDRAAPPSLSTGAPLRPYPESTLGAVLRRVAGAAQPSGLEYLRPDGTTERQSYPELLDEASRVMGALRATGLRPGDRVLLQLADNRHFVTGFWACVLGGFVAVPLATPPADQPDGAVATRAAHAWRSLGEPLTLTDRAHGATLPADRRRAVIEDLRTGPADDAPHRARPDDLILLMLTSGSTGTPKAVRLCHDNVLTHAAASRQAHGLGPADTAFNWMPLDHVGGVVMFHLAFLAAGAAQIHAPTAWVLADPLRWIEALHTRRATATWAPNFAFGLVNDQAERIAGERWDLSALRLALNGGEAVVDRVARRFVRLLAPHGLPAGAMHPVWGMSETSSGEVSAPLSATAGATDAPTEVGRPYPGFAVRITDDTDTVVPEGTVGHLQVSGPAVTRGYDADPGQNREAFTADGWFRTGDLALLRDGALTLTGRAKDVVIIGGVNHPSHELEAIVEELDDVQSSFTAACAVRAEGRDSDELALFYVLAPGADPDAAARRIREKVLREGGVNPAHLVPLDRADIPKTEIGKIQRTRLRARFEAGEFATTALGDTLPNWFFQPVWQPAALVHPAGPGAARPGGHTLLVADEAGPGERLAAALRAEGHDTTLVRRAPAAGPGPADAPLAPLDATDRAQWDALLDAMPPLGRVVHLTTGAPDDGPGADGVEEIAQLATALAARPDRYGPERPVALYVVAADSGRVLATDTPAARRAPAVALAKSLGQELPWLHTRHIDLGSRTALTAPGPDQALLAHLVAELAAPAGDTEVALRPGRGRAPARWARRLRRLPGGDLKAPAAPVFRDGGLYVISGGLGGVAVEAARHLLAAHPVRLLLLGRTPLPAPADQDRHLAEGGELARRLAAHRELSAAGDIAYAAVDITDADAVRAVVRTAERAWDTELAGVLHLAGHFAERPVTGETPEQRAAVLAPKILGGWALHQLVADRPGALFLSFSSVNGHFGGAGVGSYAAANAYLDALAAHQRDNCGIDGRSLAWSMWDERGMSRGYAMRELTEARGYRILGVREALRSLDTALCHDTPQVLIGLDPDAPWIRAQTLAPVHPLRTPAAHVETGPAPAAGAAPDPGGELPDRYGTPVGCAALPVAELPRTADGAIDRDRLARTGPSPDAEDGPDRPATATERTVAGIWRDLLQHDRIGLRDNFFELGGHSILATQMLGRLRTALGVDLTVAALFRSPTVEGLAAQADGAGPDGGADPVAGGMLDVLLPLRPAGSGTPLFCVHPGAGVGWPYAALLGGLDPDRPVYGIQARGLLPGERPAGSVREMADDYLRQIRIVHPYGPFHLLGWSFGGLVAHEMAVRLRAAGEPTGLLAMLDCLPMGALPGRPPLPAAEELERVLLGILLASSGAARPAGPDGGPDDAPPDRAGVLAVLQREDSTLRGLDDRAVSALLAVMANDTALGYAFVPGHYDGDALFFHASEGTVGAGPETGPSARAWRPYVAGRIRDHAVAGAHGDMLRPEAAADIAHLIETELKGTHR
ncbi:condensation domain-containing protein [Kitasatospora sp. NPDC088351]|uniref:condensation domain-containing protein n=1 Tax=Kitasatospora sp. NPDC088351 TaxID=3155180 RepID=UPI003421B8DC